VLLPVITAADDAEDIANRLRSAIASPFDIDGHRIMISASVGIARYPEDGDTPAELMRSADRVMYQHKQARSTKLG
jgi:diguanylate cyclase (GGDEF)-like protein